MSEVRNRWKRIRDSFVACSKKIANFEIGTATPKEQAIFQRCFFLYDFINHKGAQKRCIVNPPKSKDDLEYDNVPFDFYALFKNPLDEISKTNHETDSDLDDLPNCPELLNPENQEKEDSNADSDEWVIEYLDSDEQIIKNITAKAIAEGLSEAYEQQQNIEPKEVLDNIDEKVITETKRSNTSEIDYNFPKKVKKGDEEQIMPNVLPLTLTQRYTEMCKKQQLTARAAVICESLDRISLKNKNKGLRLIMEIIDKYI